MPPKKRSRAQQANDENEKDNVYTNEANVKYRLFLMAVPYRTQ
jgi:hypothetical protein